MCHTLIDIMCTALPDFTAIKTSHRPDKWQQAAAEISRLHGWVFCIYLPLTYDTNANGKLLFFSLSCSIGLL